MQKDKTKPLYQKVVYQKVYHFTLYAKKQTDKQTQLSEWTEDLNVSDNLLNTGFTNVLWVRCKRQGKQSKNNQMGLHPTKKLLHSKENNHQNEKESY